MFLREPLGRRCSFGLFSATLLVELFQEIGHFDRRHRAIRAFLSRPRKRLGVVLGREDAVGDRHAAVELNARYAICRFVRDDLEVIRLAAYDRTEGDEGVVLPAVSIFWSASGASSAPGTVITWTSPARTPCLSSVAVQLDSKASPMPALNRLKRCRSSNRLRGDRCRFCCDPLRFTVDVTGLHVPGLRDRTPPCSACGGEARAGAFS